MPVRFPPLARITCLAGTLGAGVLLATTALAQTPATPSAEPGAQSPSAESTPSAPTPSAQTLGAANAVDASGAPAAPAPAPRQALHAIDPVKARYSVQVMESVLERAVKYAAGRMNTRLQAVSPDLLQLSGAARARGFRLPGYGVFFDVDVPAALRHTMGWTMRLMQQSDQNVQRAVAELKQLMTAMDPKQRAQAEIALKLIEMRFEPAPRPRSITPPQEQRQPRPAVAEAPTAAETVTASSAASAMSASGPLNTSVGGVSAVNNIIPVPESIPAPLPPPAAGPEPAAPTAEDLAWAQNPDLAYELEVRDALVSAMLEYGSTLSLGPDEYLTVAARDSENVVMPGDLSETVTVLLRLKGSDLFEYKSGRLAEDDARRRIEIREF
jgi:hypothetical protein